MEEIDLMELFEYFKGKILWIIAAVILAIGVGNVVTVLTRVPMYNSNTTIVLVSENSTTYNTTEQQLNKNLVSTYAEIIKSRKVLNKVIDNLGLNCSYAKLKSNITVEAVTNTEIIRVIVSDSNPQVAAEISNEIAEVFMSEVQKIYKLNNVSVIDEAEVNKTPYNINYLKDNLIYVLVALVVSCGVIFIIYYFDTSIKTSEEIENKLGLTVVGIVPKVEKE